MLDNLIVDIHLEQAEDVKGKIGKPFLLFNSYIDNI